MQCGWVMCWADDEHLFCKMLVQIILKGFLSKEMEAASEGSKWLIHIVCK